MEEIKIDTETKYTHYLERVDSMFDKKVNLIAMKVKNLKRYWCLLRFIKMNIIQ